MFPELLKTEWAILPEYAKTALQVLERRDTTSPEQLQQFDNKEANSPFFATINPVSGAVFMAARGSSKAQAGENVAVIPIVGPMFKRANMLQQMSGAKGTEAIRNEIKQANNDPDIKAIVLMIDSPGGTVDGTEELAEVIKNSAKPIVAFADGTMASAAYWIGSQAKEIIVSGKTTIIGSIGTLMTHVDASGFYINQGVKITYITADKSTEKVLAPDSEPLDDEKVQKIKNILNPLNEVFIKSVKRGRSKKLQDTEENGTFTGKVFDGDTAIKIGLADAFGDLEYAVKKAYNLSRAKAETVETDKISATTEQATTEANKIQNKNSINMKNFLKTKFPDLFPSSKEEKEEVKSEVEKEEVQEDAKVELTEKEAEATFSTIAEYEAEMTRLNEELEAKNTQIGELEATINDQNEAIVKASEEIDTANARVQELEQTIASNTESITQKDEEISTLKADLDTYKQANAELAKETGKKAIVPKSEAATEDVVETKKPVTKQGKILQAQSNARAILDRYEKMGQL